MCADDASYGLTVGSNLAYHTSHINTVIHRVAVGKAIGAIVNRNLYIMV